jgi:hypothetical protein
MSQLSERATLLIDELPNDRLLYPEAMARFRDSQTAIVVDEPIRSYSVQQSLALLSIRFFRREARGKLDKFLPAVTEASLRCAITIDEPRIRFCVMGNHNKRRIVV